MIKKLKILPFFSFSSGKEKPALPFLASGKLWEGQKAEGPCRISRSGRVFPEALGESSGDAKGRGRGVRQIRSARDLHLASWRWCRG